MRHPTKLALRNLAMVVAITAVAIAVTVLSGPASGSKTPYMSALADLTLGSPALAAVCNFKKCDSSGSFCAVTVNRYSCHIAGNGVCTTRLCK